MKNKTRKILSSCTALAMSAALLLTGCGSDSGDAANDTQDTTASADNTGGDSGELEPVTLRWLLRIPEPEDADMVLEKVNEILKEKINATLEIEWIDAVAYPEKTKLRISSGDPFDIMFTSSGYSYFDYASMGAFVPLDDLLEEYAPETYDLIPEAYWDALRVNGEIYGIPNYQITARQTCMTFRKDIVDKYNFDISTIKTVEDMEPFLATLKENEDVQYIMSGVALTYFDTMNYLRLEGIGADGSPGAIEIDGDDYTVINQFEHENFVKLCKTLADFEDKGYLNKDLALVEDQTELQKNGEILCGVLGNWKPGAEAEALTRYGYEQENVLVTEPYVNTSSVLGTLQAISRTSENPERALMFLDLVNSDPELYNLLVYGIEGEHYTKVGDNRIELIADSGYSTGVPWMIGNTFNGYLTGDTEETVYEETQELNENAEVSRIMGFNFNPEKVSTEIAQCATVTEKYLKTGLGYGMYDDVDATIEQMNEELRAAGMDKVIAEKQAQLDEWVAANK